MSLEKFIRGKRDNANHVGLYHNKKAEQAATAHLQAYLLGDLDETSSPQQTLDKQERPTIQSRTGVDEREP